MKNQELFAALHTMLANIKKKLADLGLTGYNKNITQIEDVINQFPKLSKPRGSVMYSKKDDTHNMLQDISTVINDFYNKLGEDIKKEELTLEAEMHGTQNFSDYEFGRTKHYIAKKDLLNDLDAIKGIIATEDVGFKRQESNKFKV